MAHIIDDYEAGPRYTCLDGACMRMNVWNVSIANKQQGWDMDLSQPRQCRLHRKFQFWMCKVLRIDKKNVSHSLPGGVTSQRSQIFVFGGGRNGACNVSLLERFAQSVSAFQEMFCIRHSADHSANQHKLLHYFWMVEREVDRDFSAMRATHNGHAFQF